MAVCVSLATLRTGGSGHMCQEEELTGWKAGVPGKLDIWGWPEHFYKCPSWHIELAVCSPGPGLEQGLCPSLSPVPTLFPLFSAESWDPKALSLSSVCPQPRPAAGTPHSPKTKPLGHP